MMPLTMSSAICCCLIHCTEQRAASSCVQSEVLCMQAADMVQREGSQVSISGRRNSGMPIWLSVKDVESC